MAHCYLFCLPCMFLQAAAEFPCDSSHYYIKHANVLIPASLLQQVWSSLDDWSVCFSQYFVTKKKYKEGGVDNVSLSAQGFLALMLHLCTVFLQDSAVQMASCSYHVLWTHSVFQHSDWAEFTLKVCAVEADSDEPADLWLQQVISVIADCIKTAQDNISSWVKYWGKESSDLLSDIKNNFLNLLSGWVVGQFSFDHPIVINSVTTSSSLPSLIHSHQALLSVPSASEWMQSYLISSKVKTVKQLWHEWHVGLGGQSVIIDLNEK